ncbi:MAG: tetratricopeptide repeat protein, partial [Acidobacteria bacterium]|nr:tetratricopeptide repeat protein [Acidobacteriota bacterium]
VLIGDAYLGSQDLYLTPMAEPSLLPRLLNRKLTSAPIQTPGVELHATTIATMLFGRTLLRPGYIWQVLMLALPLLLIAIAVFRLRAFMGVLAVILIACASLLVASWSFNSYGVILPLACAWLGGTLLTPGGLSLRYGHERLVREETEAERKQIMDILSRSVSPEVAEEMRRGGDQIMLLNERRTVTIIFTDIRNFTTLSENSDPGHVVTWLNEYFSRMNEVVQQHGGFINKFIGDGLMIVFGAPLKQDEREQARRAVDCGLAMLAEVARLRQEWQATDRPQIQIGVGVHTGEASCGIVGAEQRLEYTVIGDAVNLASRLESKTKDVNVPLLLSGTTASLLGDEYKTLALGEVEVKGKIVMTEVFSQGLKKRTPSGAQGFEQYAGRGPDKRLIKAAAGGRGGIEAAQFFAAGVRLSEAGRYREALARFTEALKHNPGWPEAYYNMGVIFGRLKRTDEARKAYQRAIQSDTHLVAAYNNLGSIELDAGRYAEAIDAFRQIVRLSPQTADAHRQLGKAYALSGSTVDAIDSLKQSARLKPNAETFYDLGVVYGEAGHFSEAAAAFYEAVRLKPKDAAAAYYNLGVSRGELAQYQEALKAYLGAIRYRPNYAAARYNLALVYLKLSREREARQQLEILRALDPELAKSLAALFAGGTAQISQYRSIPDDWVKT